MDLDLLTNPTLVERFRPYFKHRDSDRHALRLGDRSVACKNAKAALAALGFARAFGDDAHLYDDQLSEAVKRFQKALGHKNIDGVIGPGTSSRLVSEVLRKFGAQRFQELDASEAIHIPTVFLSYAWGDSSRVDKLDQWLRDHKIRVIRDVNSFKAGTQTRQTKKRQLLLSFSGQTVLNQQRLLSGHSSCAAFSSDGKYLATGSWGGEIILWNWPDGKLKHRISGHIDLVTAIAFSPTGTSIVSAGRDKSVRIWDTATGQGRIVSAR